MEGAQDVYITLPDRETPVTPLPQTALTGHTARN
jgi:hypothetical protein